MKQKKINALVFIYIDSLLKVAKFPMLDEKKGQGHCCDGKGLVGEAFLV